MSPTHSPRPRPGVPQRTNRPATSQHNTQRTEQPEPRTPGPCNPSDHLFLLQSRRPEPPQRTAERPPLSCSKSAARGRRTSGNARNFAGKRVCLKTGRSCRAFAATTPSTAATGSSAPAAGLSRPWLMRDLGDIGGRFRARRSTSTTRPSAGAPPRPASSTLSSGRCGKAASDPSLRTRVQGFR